VFTEPAIFRVRAYAAGLALACGVGVALLLGVWEPDRAAVYVAAPVVIISLAVRLRQALQDRDLEREVAERERPTG
jgi:hypothetical protein